MEEVKENPMTLAEWQATLDAAQEQLKLLAPALRCADLLRELAAGRNMSWFEVIDAVRALDALRYH